MQSWFTSSRVNFYCLRNKSLQFSAQTFLESRATLTFTSLLGHMTPEKQLPRCSLEESEVTPVNGERMFTGSLFRSKAKAPAAVVAQASRPHLEEERRQTLRPETQIRAEVNRVGSHTPETLTPASL